MGEAVPARLCAARVAFPGYPWEHPFVTSQGSAYMRFRRALDRGNVTGALSAATELAFVGLAEALELTLLLADKEPERDEQAVERWHTRFAAEAPRLELRQNQAVLALLGTIPVNRLAVGRAGRAP